MGIIITYVRNQPNNVIMFNLLPDAELNLQMQPRSVDSLLPKTTSPQIQKNNMNKLYLNDKLVQYLIYLLLSLFIVYSLYCINCEICKNNSNTKTYLFKNKIGNKKINNKKKKLKDKDNKRAMKIIRSIIKSGRRSRNHKNGLIYI